ncbi:TM2 domain-containing protein [Altererythrobacter aquiaggeris]|uniref:TM2 domain-containing protein n=1 Tax=Aestuarierythrobacter aquiaggeris TaxID=1898396 RepID=UPI003016E66C
MDDNTRKQLLFEAKRKSRGVSYLLWLFLGWFGAHRFYLGKKGSAFAQAGLALLGWLPLFMGWALLSIWWIADAFLIPAMIRDAQREFLSEMGVSPAESPEGFIEPQRLARARGPIPGSRADTISKLSS